MNIAHQIDSITDPYQLYQYACELQNSGNLDEATIAYNKLLDRYPGNPMSLTGLGTIALQRGQLDEGIRLLKESLEIEPSQPKTNCDLAVALRSQGKREDALLRIERELELNPQSGEAYYLKAAVLQELGRFDESLVSIEKALSYIPDSEAASCDQGLALYSLGRHGESLQCYKKALSINPDSKTALIGMAAVLSALDRPDEAIQYSEKAIAIDSQSANAYVNKGNALQQKGDFASAATCYETAIDIQPELALAHFNLALLKLLQGDFHEGWKLYEWRWKSFLKNDYVEFSQPLWTGEQSLADKTLFVHFEQGFGDFIQFCRYIPLLQRGVAKVILEVPPALKSIALTLNGKFEIVDRGKRPSEFDYHCPIMTLPLALGTTLSNIPAADGYLSANTENHEKWKRRLGKKQAPRIGLVWSGSPQHRNDANRSIPFDKLTTLLELPLEFHSLQKQYKQQELAFIEKSQVHTHENEIDDFTDTASLIQEMDLVISVDTSVAHLAGAMGKKVWILLPHLPDFRWMLHRSDTPWYDSAVLYRQPKQGDWGSVLTAVRDELERTSWT